MRFVLLINSSGRLELGNVDNGARVPVGEQAVRSTSQQPGDRARATSFVWSPAGQWTAWSADSLTPDGIHQLRVHVEASNATEILAEALTAFYMAPSPDGRYLSHLSPGPLGLELAVSEVASGELQIVERGQPLFWAWSPQSDQLAIHVGSRVVIASLGGAEPAVLTEDAGAFSAPWWMPGGSVAMVVDDKIVCGPADGPFATLVDRAGALHFAMGPDGRRIAQLDHGEPDTRPQLIVRDLMSGTVETLTDRRIAALHWSPDGRRLAALAIVSDTELGWIIYDGEGTTDLAPFRPGRTWLRTVLPFFGQYALSHSVWSGDGTQLVIPALDEDGTTCALVQEVQPPFGVERLPDAELVWWANE